MIIDFFCYLINLKGDLVVPESRVLLLPRAPQIEILKRASLFITHNGMNSTSESIHYGVPMICLPQAMFTDQPVVAKRVADELGCGIRLKPNCESNDIAIEIKNVIRNKQYLERTLRLTYLSRRFNGAVNGANYIIKSINENESKKDN
jgi:UDP:flavonoid glycosyltransferase YjiC (YdhE family)